MKTDSRHPKADPRPMLIATPKGLATVDGWCYTTVGFRHTHAGWTLTHLPSGMAIRTVPTRPLAESLAQRLDPLLPAEGTFGTQPPLPTLQAAADAWRQWREEHDRFDNKI
jgi:hypothetical protein